MFTIRKSKYRSPVVKRLAGRQSLSRAGKDRWQALVASPAVKGFASAFRAPDCLLGSRSAPRKGD